jgi:hypothetical protein
VLGASRSPGRARVPPQWHTRPTQSTWAYTINMHSNKFLDFADAIPSSARAGHHPRPPPANRSFWTSCANSPGRASRRAQRWPPEGDAPLLFVCELVVYMPQYILSNPSRHHPADAINSPSPFPKRQETASSSQRPLAWVYIDSGMSACQQVCTYMQTTTVFASGRVGSTHRREAGGGPIRSLYELVLEHTCQVLILVTLCLSAAASSSPTTPATERSRAAFWARRPPVPGRRDAELVRSPPRARRLGGGTARLTESVAALSNGYQLHNSHWLAPTNVILDGTDRTMDTLPATIHLPFPVTWERR